MCRLPLFYGKEDGGCPSFGLHHILPGADQKIPDWLNSGSTFLVKAGQLGRGIKSGFGIML